MKELIEAMSETRYWGNTLFDYALSVVVLVMALMIAMTIKKILVHRLKTRSMDNRSPLMADVLMLVKRDLFSVIYAAIVYKSITLLALGGYVQKIINALMAFALIFLSVKFLQSLALIIIERYWEAKHEAEGGKNVANAAKVFIKILLWLIGLLIFLDNVGVKISGIIAGLGLGGIFIAFAAQSLLSDFFSYFSIIVDRPFEIGDFILLDDNAGTIAHIGIKTTRIRALSGEELIVPNAHMTGSRIRNFKHMERRRVMFTFGVTYETSAATLKKIPAMVEKIIKDIDEAEFDRVHFTQFGDFSLNFEVVYHVSGGDFSLYRDVQQRINFTLKETFDRQNIEFAYPTQTVYVKK
jgi:small-conductance mechanosensitive channel